MSKIDQLQMRAFEMTRHFWTPEFYATRRTGHILGQALLVSLKISHSDSSAPITRSKGQLKLAEALSNSAIELWTIGTASSRDNLKVCLIKYPRHFGRLVDERVSLPLDADGMAREIQATVPAFAEVLNFFVHYWVLRKALISEKENTPGSLEFPELLQGQWHWWGEVFRRFASAVLDRIKGQQANHLTRDPWPTLIRELDQYFNLNLPSATQTQGSPS